MVVYINAISYYLPENSLTNENLSVEFPEWSVEKIADKIGIKNRQIAGKDEFVSDLSVKAAIKLFKSNNIDPLDIDYIILCTQSPDYFLPTTACLIQHRLGIPKTAGAIDINQGCSGFLYGLNLAKGLILSEDFKNVLLITAETYSKFLHSKDKSNRTIFGDAAAAILLSINKGICTIGKFIMGSDGSGAENLILKRGAAKYPRINELDQDSNLDLENYLYMNGPEIFNFSVEVVPKQIDAILKHNNLTVDKIDLFVFHQANKFMLEFLRRKMKIPEDKFYIYMENCGNTVSSTIPIALSEAINEGKVKTGDKVLIVGFGVGYSWGSTILYF